MSFFGLFGSNLAQRASEGKLTVEEVNSAKKEKMEKDKDSKRYTVLYNASKYCSIEVVEAILDKKVNIDGLSGRVSIGINYYVIVVIKLTLFNNELTLKIIVG
jgi:hypothetical protein